jgi:hypothetical protein
MTGKRRTKSKQFDAADYVTAWDDRIAGGITDELVRQWYAERDLRDDLTVPVAERVRLLDLIDPIKQ